MRAYIKAAGRKKVIGWIVKGLIFVLLFALLFSAAQRLLQAKWMSTNTMFSTEYKSLEKDTVDVIFAGSSLIYSGIDPMIIYEDSGICTYSLSAGGLRFDLNYTALQDFLKTQSPSLILLDMSAIHYKKQSKEPRIHLLLDQLSFSWPKLQFALDSDNEDLTVLNAMFPLLRYHSRWDELDETDFRYMTGTMEETYTRGHVVRYETVPTVMQFYDNPEEEAVDVTDRVCEYLKKIADLCEKEGIELILCRIPTPEWREAQSETAAELAEELGLSYWEMFYDIDEIGIDPATDYRDTKKHMNQSGAEKMSHYLASWLEENYDFEDQRGSNQRWDEDLPKYKALLEEAQNQ